MNLRSSRLFFVASYVRGISIVVDRFPLAGETRMGGDAGWLQGVSLMGGSTDAGNITSHAEFNVASDPQAAAVDRVVEGLIDADRARA